MMDMNEFIPFETNISSQIDMRGYHCLKCKYEEDIPRFMVDEFSENDVSYSDYHFNNKEIITMVLVCPICNSEFICKNQD